jgi:hypothetical protein
MITLQESHITSDSLLTRNKKKLLPVSKSFASLDPSCQNANETAVEKVEREDLNFSFDLPHFLGKGCCWMDNPIVPPTRSANRCEGPRLLLPLARPNNTI